MRNLFGLALGAGIVAVVWSGDTLAQSGPGGPHGPGGPGGPPPGGPGGPGIPGPGGPHRPPPLPPFAFLDADGNGLISKAEFTAGMQLLHDAHDAFRTADANRDGALDAT